MGAADVFSSGNLPPSTLSVRPYGLIPGASYYAQLYTVVAGNWYTAGPVQFQTNPPGPLPDKATFYSSIQSLTSQVREMAYPGPLANSGTPLAAEVLQRWGTAEGPDCVDFSLTLIDQLIQNGIPARRRNVTLTGTSYEAHTTSEYYDPFLSRWAVSDATFGVFYFDDTAPQGQSVEDLSALVLSGNFAAVGLHFVSPQGDAWFRHYYMDPVTLYLNPSSPSNTASSTALNDARPYLSAHALADVQGISAKYVFQFALPTDSLGISDIAGPVTMTPADGTSWSGSVPLDADWTAAAPPPNLGTYTFPVFWTHTATLKVPAEQSVNVDPDSSVFFRWSEIAGAQAYRLQVGTSTGASDAFDSGVITVNRAWVALQPATTYAVRVWTEYGNAWTYRDTTIQTGTGASHLLSPAPGSTGLQPYTPLQLAWSAISDAQAYTVYVGTSAGASDVFSTGETLATSASITLWPGRVYYIRVWTEKSGEWYAADAAVQTLAGNAQILSPANGAGNVDPSLPVAISWASVPDAVSYFLYVGTSLGANDVYSSGETQATSLSVPLQPNTSYYLRIWTRKASGWYSTDSTLQTGTGIARLTAPANNAVNVDPNSPISFTWSPVLDALSYSLWIGTSAGANDAYTAGGTLSTGAVVTLNPSTTYYVRVWTQKAQGWYYSDSTFQTGLGISRLVLPANNATGLDPYQVQFSWSSITGALSYSLYVGSTPGGKDVYASGEVTTTTLSITLLPNTSYYARIWTKTESGWNYSDSAFQTGAGTAHLIAPAPNSTVSDPNVATTVSWTSVADAISYTLWIGTAPGLKDIYAGSAVQATSASVQLPRSATCYIRVWTDRPSGWYYSDSVVTTGAGLAHLISPPDGNTSVNPFPAQFAWNPISDAVSYSVYVGSSLGAKDLYASGEVQGTGISASLPADILCYVRLWTRKQSGWYYVDTTFQTGNNIAWISSPANNATNIDASIPVPIAWNSAPGALAYSLYVGTSVGARDVYASGEVLATTISVNLQPSTSYYLRIWTEVAAGWVYTDSAFQTGSGIARLLTPQNNATNVDPYQVQFNWTAVSDALSYSVYVGTSVGANNVYASGEVQATGTAYAVPASTVLYVRLWTKKASGWYYSDSVFTSGVLVSHLISPAANSTVGASSPVQLAWSSVPGALCYTLYIGTSLGAKDVYVSGETQNTTAAVSLQPAQTYFVRVWTQTSAGWYYVDSSFQTTP